MVTREDVKLARRAFNKIKYNNKLTKDELNVIDDMIANYEFKYKM